MPAHPPASLNRRRDKQVYGPPTPAPTYGPPMPAGLGPTQTFPLGGGTQVPLQQAPQSGGAGIGPSGGPPGTLMQSRPVNTGGGGRQLGNLLQAGNDSGGADLSGAYPIMSPSEYLKAHLRAYPAKMKLRDVPHEAIMRGYPAYQRTMMEQNLGMEKFRAGGPEREADTYAANALGNQRQASADLDVERLDTEDERQGELGARASYHDARTNLTQREADFRFGAEGDTSVRPQEAPSLDEVKADWLQGQIDQWTIEHGNLPDETAVNLWMQAISPKSGGGPSGMFSRYMDLVKYGERATSLSGGRYGDQGLLDDTTEAFERARGELGLGDGSQDDEFSVEMISEDGKERLRVRPEDVEEAERQKWRRYQE